MIWAIPIEPCGPQRLMDRLEQDFPQVTFVYMTGHLNGDGLSGNTRVRNDQIRQHCQQNNKILFDFADIERHDPNGNEYPNDNDGCNWFSAWCNTRSCPSCSCAHLHCFNCYNKGKAFWWLMAKLAGWGSGMTPTLFLSILPFPPQLPPLRKEVIKQWIRH